MDYRGFSVQFFMKGRPWRALQEGKVIEAADSLAEMMEVIDRRVEGRSLTPAEIAAEQERREVDRLGRRIAGVPGGEGE